VDAVVNAKEYLNMPKDHRATSFQITLRTIFLVITAFGIGPLGWIAHERTKSNRNRKAILALQSREATILYSDYRQSKLSHVLLGDRQPACVNRVFFSKAKHDDLIQLRDLPRLEHLSFEEDLAEADWPLLPDIPSPIRLSLIAAPISDDKLQYIGKLRNLRELYIDSTQISDAGLGHLKGLRLRELSISSTGVTDGGMIALRDLPHLELLNLSDTSITNLGLMRLQEIVTLKTVHVASTEVTLEGIQLFNAARPGVAVLQ
jgi:hypothetical protein